MIPLVILGDNVKILLKKVKTKRQIKRDSENEKRLRSFKNACKAKNMDFARDDSHDSNIEWMYRASSVNVKYFSQCYGKVISQ